MKTAVFIEKMEKKLCWFCSHFKKKKQGYKLKFDITCEENQRMKGLTYHPTVILKYIDREKMTCSNFKREFK